MGRFNNNKGFTLIELMLTIGILGVILLFISQILSFNTKLVKHEDARIEYIQNARLAANYIIRDIRENDVTAIQYISGIGESNIRGSGKLVLDAVAHNPDYLNGLAAENVPELWHAWLAEKNYGELRDKSNNMLASFIKSIQITNLSASDAAKKYLRVTVTAGRDSEETSLAVVVPLSLVSAIPITPDIVAYYDFTADPMDGTSNENNGVPTSTDNHGGTAEVIYAEGHDGTPQSALELDGSYFISVEPTSYNSLDSITQEMTIDLWCSPSRIGEKMTMMDRTRDESGSGYELYLNEFNSVVFDVGGTSVTSVISLPMADASGPKWSHVKVTYEKGAINGMRIYIDVQDDPGDSFSVPNAQINAPNEDITDTSNPLRIGTDRIGNSENNRSPFYGYLDDIIVRNVADYN